MVLLAMSMLLFLPGIYVFNGVANISLSLCTNIYSKRITTATAR